MNRKLSPELAAALVAAPNGIEVVNPLTNQTVLICDPWLQRRAKELLDHQAIAEGIRCMETGDTEPLDEAFDSLRRSLDFPDH